MKFLSFFLVQEEEEEKDKVRHWQPEAAKTTFRVQLIRQETRKRSNVFLSSIRKLYAVVV